MTTSSRPTESTFNSILILGCGRKFRGDDQVGLMTAELLDNRRRQLPAEARIVATEAPCATHFVECEPNDLLILIDAARASADFPPGAIRRIDFRRQSIRLLDDLRTNTHTLGVETALSLGDALGLLPRDVWIYAVACDHFEFGDAPGQDLRPAAESAANQIVADVANWTRTRTSARNTPMSPVPS